MSTQTFPPINPTPARQVVNIDDAASTPAAIRRYLKGDPTLTITISGVMASGKSVIARIIEKSMKRYFEALDDVMGLGGYIGCPINRDCRVVIKTEIRKEVKKMKGSKKPMKKEKPMKK